MSGEKLSSTASYGALDRKVRVLRDAVSAYDKETADRKRVAERSGGPAARFVVDQLRAPGFHKLRERLRAAELALASWKPRKRKAVADDRPFSEMVKATLAARPLAARAARDSDTRRMAETGTGSVRSTSSAGGAAASPDPQSEDHSHG